MLTHEAWPQRIATVESTQHTHLPLGVYKAPMGENAALYVATPDVPRCTPQSEILGNILAVRQHESEFYEISMGERITPDVLASLAYAAFRSLNADMPVMGSAPDDRMGERFNLYRDTLGMMLARRTLQGLVFQGSAGTTAGFAAKTLRAHNLQYTDEGHYIPAT